MLKSFPETLTSLVDVVLTWYMWIKELVSKLIHCFAESWM